MEKLPKQPSAKGPSGRFTGEVWIDTPYIGREPSRMRVRVVHFAPGARTAWHTHPAGQFLHVTEGVALTQARGGEVVSLRPGDSVHSPPGEWHWHGAAPDHFMTHFAVTESPGGGAPESEWGDHVTDDEYHRTRS
ncbi:(R)-mandelonitrile lyase [Spirillospora sp. CA-255316]